MQARGVTVGSAVASGLEPVLEQMLLAVQDAKDVNEGATFRFGWSELRLAPFNSGLVLVQRDWLNDPSQWIADVTLTALLARTFGLLLGRLVGPIPDGDMLLNQTVLVDRAYAKGPVCAIFRDGPVDPEHSGWFLNTFPPPDLEPGATVPCDAVPAYQLLQTFPAAVAAMALPQGFTAIFDREPETILTILDPGDEECLAN